MDGWMAREKEEQLAEQAVGVEHGSLNLLVVALTSDKNYGACYALFHEHGLYGLEYLSLVW